MEKNLNSFVNHIAKPGIGKLKGSHIHPPGKSDHLSLQTNSSKTLDIYAILKPARLCCDRGGFICTGGKNVKKRQEINTKNGIIQVLGRFYAFKVLIIVRVLNYLYYEPKITSFRHIYQYISYLFFTFFLQQRHKTSSIKTKPSRLRIK